MAGIEDHIDLEPEVSERFRNLKPADRRHIRKRETLFAIDRGYSNLPAHVSGAALGKACSFKDREATLRWPIAYRVLPAARGDIARAGHP